MGTAVRCAIAWLTFARHQRPQGPCSIDVTLVGTSLVTIGNIEAIFGRLLMLRLFRRANAERIALEVDHTFLGRWALDRPANVSLLLAPIGFVRPVRTMSMSITDMLIGDASVVGDGGVSVTRTWNKAGAITSAPIHHCRHVLTGTILLVRCVVAMVSLVCVQHKLSAVRLAVAHPAVRYALFRVSTLVRPDGTLFVDAIQLILTFD